MIVSLSHVAEINPKANIPAYLARDEMLDFLPMADVSETGTVSVTTQRPLSEVQKGFTAFRRGDILIAKITPCFENNKIAVADIATEVGFGSTEFHVVRCDQSRLDSRYVLHLLRSNDVRVEGKKRMTGSAGQQRVPKKFLEDLQIPLPPLEEQKRIAAILDQADELGRKRQHALARINQLGRAIFVGMFGDQTQHPLREISEFAEVKGGKRLPKGSDYAREPTPHPYIRVSDMNGFSIDERDIKYISPETHASVRRYIVNSTDVIISIAGTIGITAKVPHSLDGANLTENAAKITPRPGVRFSPTYVSWALRMPSARSQIVASTGQVTIGKLALFRVEKIAIPMPDLQRQLRFERIVESLDEEVSRYNQYHHRADGLFASLQHRAFGGEL